LLSDPPSEGAGPRRLAGIEGSLVASLEFAAADRPARQPRTGEQRAPKLWQSSRIG
jgi:hypothetical protein